MLFLGIDGGGTKTKVFVINELKEILYEGTSGPSSLDTVTNEVTVSNINLALYEFFNNDKFKNTIFESVFAGLGGIPDIKAQEILYQLLANIKGVNNKTLRVARSDMENALASGLCFEEGITLIAGTGMVAFGRNKDGMTARAGGLGYKEGDFGSSYSLGFMAIQTAARVLDKRYEETPFATAIIKELNLNQPSDVASLMELWHDERTKVASLAPFVTKYADHGDMLAINIANKMSYELALSVKSVYTQLKIKKPILVIVGSLGNVDGYFKRKLHEQIQEFAPSVNIIAPLINPGYAAALLALKHYQNSNT